MGKYNIKEIEHLSGIKAHTIRIWEKRYKIVEPKRTSTNIRYYDDEDLKKILNVAILNRNGYKISKIATLANEKLNNELINFSQQTNNLEAQIGLLITSMVDFDKDVFEKTFSKSILQIGFQDTILKLIYPFFKRIGILWLTGNIDPSQEHFISNIVRQKIIVAIDSLPEQRNFERENFILYLPDGQWHEMGLLMCSYLIKKNGFSDIYLGSSLPLESVLNLGNIIDFSHIITTTSVTKSPEEVERDLITLSGRYSDKFIFVGGLDENMPNKDFPANIHLMNNLDDFNAYLVQLGASRDIN
ncbi:MAG: MerR family transcriptional regulator [Bacteroidetes bacterium]|nr:MerR family transcriptional regulator [Bacteroidota bacterium]